MQHERLFAFAGEPVDDLRVAAGAQGRHHQCLRLAAGEQGRAMRTRQDADLGDDRAHGLGVAAVDARMSAEDTLAHQSIFEIAEFGADLVSGELCRRARGIGLRQGVHGRRFDFLDLRVALLLFGQQIGFREILFGK